MELADPPATPIAQPFKVGDLVHVFEGACKGRDVDVVVSGCASVFLLVILVVFLPLQFVCP